MKRPAPQLYRRRLAWLLFVSAMPSCGTSSPAAPTVAACSPLAPSSSSRLYGAVADPIGDATRTPIGSPDLAGASFDLHGDTLTVVILFAHSTLNQTAVHFEVYLDTDEDPSTGFPGSGTQGVDTGIIGADYTITSGIPRSSSTVEVHHWVGTTYTTVGTADVVFPCPDQVMISVPAKLLGNSDGHMAFKVAADVWVSDVNVSQILDVMPDVGSPPGYVR